MAQSQLPGKQIGPLDLTTEVTSTLPVANGGTGKASITANTLLLGNGTSAPTELAPGSAGNVVRSNGTVWASASIPARSFPLKSTCVAIGDSITVANGYSGDQTYMGDSWFTHLCVESEQRIQWYGLWGAAGYTLADIQTNLLPSVLALSPAPGACIIAGGTNDVTSGTFNFTNSKATLIAMIASLLTANITPILSAIPPRGDNSTANVNAAKWNSWIARYAAQNGYSVLDFYTATVASNGQYISGYGNADGVHTLGAGNHAISLRAINDGIHRIFPVSSVLTSQANIDTTNIFNNGSGTTYGLMTTDTNADGVADGWGSYFSGGSGGTFSRVTPTVADEVSGMWQQLARSVGDTGTAVIETVNITTGWSVGDVMAFSSRIQTEDIETVTTVWGFFAYCQGAAAPDHINGAYSWSSDTDGLMYVEFAVPASTTVITLQLFMNAITAGTGNPKLRIGEVTLRNLTTGSMLV